MFWSLYEIWPQLIVNVAPITDVHDSNDAHLVIDLVNDAVVSDANAPTQGGWLASDSHAGAACHQGQRLKL
jgi:hypothetical protein